LAISGTNSANWYMYSRAIKQCDHVISLIDNNSDRGTLLHELLQLSKSFSLSLGMSEKIRSLASALAASSTGMTDINDEVILKKTRDYLVYVKRQLNTDKTMAKGLAIGTAIPSALALGGAALIK